MFDLWNHRETDRATTLCGLHYPFMSSTHLIHCLNTCLPIPISSVAQMSLKKKLKIFKLWATLVLATVGLSLVGLVRCQDVNDYNSQFDNPAALRLITSVVYSKVSNLTAAIGQDFSNRTSFCIKDWWVIRFSFPIFFVAQKSMKRNGSRMLNLVILISFGCEQSTQVSSWMKFIFESF